MLHRHMHHRGCTVLLHCRYHLVLRMLWRKEVLLYLYHSIFDILEFRSLLLHHHISAFVCRDCALELLKVSCHAIIFFFGGAIAKYVLRCHVLYFLCVKLGGFEVRHKTHICLIDQSLETKVYVAVGCIFHYSFQDWVYNNSGCDWFLNGDSVCARMIGTAK